jgi:drug/metabolite transporter (DMT)-like permease
LSSLSNQRTVDSQQPANPASFWPDISLLGVALIWGINIPIMKIGLEQVDVFVFNAVRLVISAIVLAGFAVRERRAGVLPQPGLAKRQIVIYAIVVSGLYQLLFLVGIAKTTSGNTALIISTVPMWTALIARIFLGEKLLKLAWAGLCIALAGTVVVALQKNNVSVGRAHLTGNLCVLAAALAWATGTVYSRPMLKLISPMQLSASSAVLALPLHLLFAVGNYSASVQPLQSVSLWMIILYSGVLSTGLALPMWSFGVRHAGAAHASAIQNLIPLIAIIAAWISRGESITTGQMIGGSLIVGGLLTMRAARLWRERTEQISND